LAALPAALLAPAAVVVAESAAARFFRLCFVNIQRTPVEVFAIQGGNSALGFAVDAHFHESEAPGASRIPVSYDVHTVYLAISLEHGSNRLFGGPEAEVTYKDIFHLSLFSGICRAANRGQDRAVGPDYASVLNQRNCQTTLI